MKRGERKLRSPLFSRTIRCVKSNSLVIDFYAYQRKNQ